MSGNCAEVTGNLSGVRIGGDVQSVQFACDCVTLTLIRGALLDYYESTVQSSADYSPVDDNSLEFAEVVPVGRLDGAGYPNLGRFLGATVWERDELYFVVIEGDLRTIRFSCRRSSFVLLLRDLAYGMAQSREICRETRLAIL